MESTETMELQNGSEAIAEPRAPVAAPVAVVSAPMKKEKKLNFGVEPEIHESLVGHAERRGWTLAQLIREYIRRGLEQDGVTIAPARRTRRRAPAE